MDHTLRKFFTGGCLDFAYASQDALVELEKEGDIVGVNINGTMHHIMIYIEDEDSYFDAGGFHTADEVTDTWGEMPHGKARIVRNLTEDDLFVYGQEDDRYEEAYEIALSYF